MKKSVLSMILTLAMIFIQLPQVYAKESTEVIFEDANENIQISTLEELEAFRDDVNGGNTYEGKTVELTADIDMSEKYGEGKEIWTPIANNNSFEGEFDGNGHTIKMNHVDPYYYTDSGLFYFCGEKSHITRLTIDGIVKLGTPTEDDSEWAQPPFYLGGVVGLSLGRISNCHNKAEIIGYGNGAYTAGICGLSGGTIENCTNTGIIYGGYVSDAISITYGSGEISNCYYLDGTSEYSTDAKVMTAEQFASGEVCYLLNGGKSDGAWYQNIGSDAFPVLDSTHSAVSFDGERYYNKINAEHPYEITSIRLTDTAGEVIAMPNIGQSFIVETGISKFRERNEQDYLFVAVYDEDGVLMNMDNVRVNFTVSGEYAFGFNVPAQNKKIGYVKAFVWNTFSSMEPLAAAETYAPLVFE